MPTTLRGRQGIRLLGPADRAQVEGLLARDPVTNVFVADRVASTGLDQRWLGGRIYGYLEDGELTALCHHAANLVPVRAHRAAVEAFAERAVSDGRSCSSLFGPQDAVLGLWERLQPQWGAARSVRADQPFQCMQAPSTVEPDPAVRVVRLDELDLVYPASVAMFTEEMGVSPEVGGADAYRARVAQLISQGRMFARIEDGRVLFKAEVGAATAASCQVQSVFVDRAERGRGLATQGMASVVAAALRDWAPAVTLYVNADNLAARRVYDKVGFVRTATFATVLL
ncbi:MAG: GNAT family N-acetyltransferase [Actinomycetota bacterium]|nr:GNAT family N-acetyltransferase [Actinomycetota bacterium]